MTLHPVTDVDSAADVIVSRHVGTIAWLRAECPHLASAPVLASATPTDVVGRHVWGNVPLHLAAVVAAERQPTTKFSGGKLVGFFGSLAEAREVARVHLRRDWRWAIAVRCSGPGKPVALLRDGTPDNDQSGLAMDTWDTILDVWAAA